MLDLSHFPKPFICLMRHGETSFSRARRYNGLTDAELTEHGESQAKAAASSLRSTEWEAVLCSPLKRARRTAELAGFDNLEIVQELIEFNYGDYEGKTTQEILDVRPDWDFWKHGCPEGEQLLSAGNRLDNVIHRFKDFSKAVLVFSHSHAIRILTARWLELPSKNGSFFEYDPAHISVIGIHRGRPVIMLWNYGSHLSR